ncbi:MAG: hypothetical protein ABIO40_06555 [Devosia sp.]
MKFGLDLQPQQKVFGGFGIYAFALGNIFPRLPDIQHAMGVAEGAFGLGLIGAPVGTLISLSFATPLLERIGFRRAILALIPLMSVFMPSPVLRPTRRCSLSCSCRWVW